MTTTRFRRIAELWNWLPGFRAVAEHQSVHGAATALHVSPSALSRTVKLLEDALGSELFTRKATGLELTAFGAELAAVTRDTMRQLDDCIAREDRRRGGLGPFYVGAGSELAHAVIARALAGGLDGFGVIDVVHIDGEVADELHQGNVDLVVTADLARQSDLVAARLGDVGFAVLYALALLVGKPLEMSVAPSSRRRRPDLRRAVASTLARSACQGCATRTAPRPRP